MSSNEDPAAERDQEVTETEEVEVGEGSNGDPAATRDQEVKETEEVDVGEGPAGGGEHAVEGGEHAAVGGGDGPVIVVTEVAGPSSYTDQEVAGLTPDQALAAVRHGSLSAPQMSRVLDVCRQFVALADGAETSSVEAQAD